MSKIGSVSIWLGEPCEANHCIMALDAEVFIHGTVEQLEAFSEEIQQQIATVKEIRKPVAQ